MRQLKFLLVIAFVSLATVSVRAQQQDNPTPEKMAEEMANKYIERFELDDYQSFMVDSTLQFNYARLMEEVEEARRGGRTNSEVYQVICDKWYDACDKVFESVFSEEQWAKFLKSEFGKEKRRRDKRMQDRARKGN